MNWWIIAILVILVVIVLKFKEVRHKLGFLIVLALLLFFAVTAFSVYKTHEVDLKTFDGVVTAGKIYVAWLGGVFQNFKGITGYAAKQDWKINNTSLK